MTERWRPVLGWADLYEVSDGGMVRRSAGGRGARAGRILTPRPTSKGYLRVALHSGAGRVDASIHRLVASAFLGAPPSTTHEVNHCDGDKTNNMLSNLEWTTPSENMQHAVDTGLAPTTAGESNGRARLTESDVVAIRAAPSSVTGAELARQFGVSKSAVDHARSGRTWQNLCPRDEAEALARLRGPVGQAR